MASLITPDERWKKLSSRASRDGRIRVSKRAQPSRKQEAGIRKELTRMVALIENGNAEITCMSRHVELPVNIVRMFDATMLV